MSHLIPDFVLNPVLRQARRFSRANPAEDPDQQTRHQIDPSNSDEAGPSNITEHFGSAEGAEIGAGDALTIGSRATSPLFREDDSFSGGVEEREESSPPPGPATPERSQMAPQQQSSDLGRTEPEVSADPLHSSRDALGEGGVMDGPSSPAAQDSSQPESSGVNQSNALPADDGMQSLREQIVQIQSMPLSTEQKAKSMHRLLAENYYRSQEVASSKEQSKAPEKIISQERPSSPPSLSSILWHMNGVVDDSPPEEQYTFHLTPDDLKRTYAPIWLIDTDEESPARSSEDPEEVTEQETQVLGCPHYQRNVKLQCSTCGRWYTCRLCHDEVEDHILVRRATKNMLCMICGSAQRAGEFCVQCGERAAWYYCDVCKLWDNDARKSIYHCNDCGICRKGQGLGKDYFHCKVGL
jgi:uncharacterized CHY-type Zn-finger protein